MELSREGSMRMRLRIKDRNNWDNRKPWEFKGGVNINRKLNGKIHRDVNRINGPVSGLLGRLTRRSVHIYGCEVRSKGQ